MTKAKRKGRSILNRLTPDEAMQILRTLLARHPALLPEAEKIAGAAVAAVDVESVAADVDSDLAALDVDALYACSGSSRWGYTDPSEAAWEMLEEAVEPYVSEMERLMDLDMSEAAEKVFKGIILGLYRARGENTTGVLGWAPDFPKVTALEVARTFIECMHRRKGEAPPLPEDFLASQVPEWEEPLSRARGKKPGSRRRE